MTSVAFWSFYVVFLVPETSVPPPQLIISLPIKNNITQNMILILNSEWCPIIVCKMQCEIFTVFPHMMFRIADTN